MVDVDICNLALSYLGDTATVTSIAPAEGSAQAQHCARFYPMALNLLLESHPWNFATKRIELAQVAAPYSDRWMYAYQRPSDALTVVTIIPKCIYPVSANWMAFARPFAFEVAERDFWRDFELEVDGQGRQVILSNVAQAIGRYTSSEVQPSAFPALFADALAWRLASMLAGPLLKGDAGAAESKRCLQASMAVAAQAMGKDANQQHEAARPMPVWMRDR